MSTTAKWVIGVIVVLLIIWGVSTLTGTTNPPEGEPIKIGQISALSGVGVLIGEQEQQGARLAVEEINANGGVLGRPIELISEDLSLDKIRVAGSVTQKLINVDEVVAIVGPQWDEPALAIAPIIEANKIPTVSPNLTPVAEQTENYAYLFSTWYSNEVGVREVLEFAQNRGWTRIAVIQPGKLGFWEFVSDLFLEHASEYGVEVVHEDYGTDLLNTDYRTLLLKAKAANPDAVFGTFAEYECPFVTQMQELGLNVPLLSTESAATPQVLENCPETLEENLYFSIPAQTETHQVFNQKYTERWGSLPTSPTAITAYDAVRVIAAAIEEIGGTDAEALREALTSMEFDEGAALSVIEFDEKGYLITPLDAFEMQTVTNGEFVSVE